MCGEEERGTQGGGRERYTGGGERGEVHRRRGEERYTGGERKSVKVHVLYIDESAGFSVRGLSGMLDGWVDGWIYIN